MTLSKLKTFVLATTAVGLTISLILYPKASFEASLRGMTIWWEIVFPSLLPFFIVAELLIGFGVVTVIGALLEPFMRPLFNVPGVGGFVWALGLASGNPAGAKLTARLRHEGQLTKSEAERLVTFTSSANPLFIFGAVAVGFFQKPALGILLASAHYVSNIFVGLLMRFVIKEKRISKIKPSEKTKQSPSVKKLLQLLHEERIKERRPFGKLLGDAVQSSVQTLLFIGGFIILFSVFNNALTLFGLSTFIAAALEFLLAPLQLSSEASFPLSSGLFEMTLGAQMVGESNAPLLEKAMLASFLLGFSGFSIHAQVASILAPSDIRFQPFFFARFLHGIFAAILTFLLYEPLFSKKNIAVPTTIENETAPFLNEPFQLAMSGSWEIIASFGSTFTLFALVIYIVLKATATIKKR